MSDTSKKFLTVAAIMAIISIGMIHQSRITAQETRKNLMGEGGRTVKLDRDAFFELQRKADPRLSPTFHIYPDTIYVGDTVYIQCVYDNTNGEEMVKFTMPSDHHYRIIQQLSLQSIEGREWWKFMPPLIDSGDIASIPFEPINYLPAGDKRTFYTKVQVPSLDALDQAFWKGLCFSKSPYKSRESKYWREEMPLPFVLDFRQKGKEIPLNLLLRNPQEMELIRRWYENTPREMLPMYQLPLAKEFKMDMSSYWTPARFGFHRDYTNSKLSSGTNFIRIKEEKVEPRLLVGLGNHTPGDPNCPETWQGWKELEESLTPSTMRDEIRMTRIVIQYCDTEDLKVLDELTEWLQNMNEIQRIVMVQNVINPEGRLLQNEKINTPMNKLIETIRPFSAEDISSTAEEILH